MLNYNTTNNSPYNNYYCKDIILTNQLHKIIKFTPPNLYGNIFLRATRNPKRYLDS